VSDNLDLVRSIYAQWERDDWSYGWADPEIEYLAGDSLESGVSSGIAAMDASWRRFREAWGEFHPAVEELRELDDRRVLVLIHRSGRGKASGVELESNSAHLFEIREGKVVRFVHYWDRDRALADLGLPHDSMSHENAQLVRSAVAAFNARDMPAMEALFADDFALRVIGGLSDMTGDQFQGRVAAIDWIKDLTETIDGFLAIETVREIGNRVLLIARFDTSGAASGAEASWQIGQVYSVRDRQISGLDSYYSAGEALRALGVEDG
jgi:ketosteroid isomerase-like protein